MATIDTTKPRWWAPAEKPQISIYNTLTRKKDPFVPIKDGKVSWYACGPTVYDDAHLGHARNYVSTDIIRRILKDYFKYDVQFVMNITDVDDKIILRGRQQYLLFKYRKANESKPQVVRDTALVSLREYVAKRLPLITGEVTAEGIKASIDQVYGWLQTGQGRPADIAAGSDDEAKLKMHIRTVTKASEAMIVAPTKWDEVAFYEGAEDILLPYLDSLEGSQIDASDHSIFTTLTTRYEDRFMQDMRNLNVLEPNELTRVTEYGQKIIDFVARVEKNGFAYKTDDGSVYFDISAFERKEGNQYARLKPENRGDKALQADGEGALSKNTSGKRSDADFALWKASKPGEPSWKSPWGLGRPGWHIECSAMAADKLGDEMDIHSGGIDLAFPHHDNELAQSEAWLRDAEHDHGHTWVKYFMHMGHLSIQGSKMSKSLKNFTTIRNALAQKQWTSRSLRIVFLLGAWSQGIEITDDMVMAGNSWEERVHNFFLNAIDLSQQKETAGKKDDQVVQEALQQAMSRTQAALADSFDTPKAMAEISTLITVFNSTDKTQLSPEIALDAARWVTALVNILGLNGTATTADTSLGWEGVAIPDSARFLVYPLSQYRDTLRRRARDAAGLQPTDLEPPSALIEAQQKGASDSSSYAAIASQFVKSITDAASSDAAQLKYKVLSLCDELRDTHLWSQDVYLEDRDKEQLPALVRPVTAQMKEEKLRATAEKEQREKDKAASKAKKDAEEAAKLAKGKLAPQDMFKNTEEYSAWDADGVPTKDAKGEELPKSRVKKLRKDWEAQKKAHEKWQKSQ